MSWKFNGNEPLFFQIAKHLRADILAGRYLPDEQMPSVRQLAYDAAVNPNTMQKALCLLEEEGLVYSKGTVGRFVTSDTSIIEKSKKQFRIDAVKSWLHEADALGMTAEDLVNCINLIKEEEKTL